MPPNPVGLRFSRLVRPVPRRILEERVGEQRSTIDELPFANDDEPWVRRRPGRRWPGPTRPGRVLDHREAIWQAILAMSIVLLFGLAVLAIAHSAP